MGEGFLVSTIITKNELPAPFREINRLDSFLL
jgi:hypothetical protein